MTVQHIEKGLRATSLGVVRGTSASPTSTAREQAPPTLRVLHVFKVYLPDSIGGVEQVIYQICESSPNFAVQAEVLALSAASAETPLTIGGHRLHRVARDFTLASTGVSWRMIGRLRELAREVDLIHYHFPWPFMDVAHYLAGVRKPNIITYHSDIVRQRLLLWFYKPLLRRFLGQAERIVATSPNYLSSSPVLQAFRDKTTVIPIGLDRALYPPAPEHVRQRWVAQFGQQRFFLFVGVMRYYKGLHILIEALRGTDIKVLLVGVGPLQNKLLQQARACGVEHNLSFLGHLDEIDKIALLELCYGVVFPSHLRSEAFGVSLLEGAMFGKPLISSELGTGTSYINKHGETGLVVPPDDPPAFRAAMQTLWDDPPRAAYMGRRAAERYAELFTAEQMGSRYAELYRQVCTECSEAL